MGLFGWMDKSLEKLRWWDIGILKISVAAFVLMIAVLWAPLVNVEWWVYGLIFLVTYVILLFRIFRR